MRHILSARGVFCLFLMFLAAFQANAQLKATVHMYFDALSLMLSEGKWDNKENARTELEEEINEIFTNSNVDITIRLRLEETSFVSLSSRTNTKTLDILSQKSSLNKQVEALWKDAIEGSLEPADIVGLLNYNSVDDKILGMATSQLTQSKDWKESGYIELKYDGRECFVVNVSKIKEPGFSRMLAIAILHETGHIFGLAHECNNPVDGSSDGISPDAHGLTVTYDGKALAHTIMSYGEPGTDPLPYFSNANMRAREADVYIPGGPIRTLVPASVMFGVARSGSGCTADEAKVLNDNKMVYQSIRVASNTPKGLCTVPDDGDLKKIVSYQWDCGKEGCVGNESCAPMDLCMEYPYTCIANYKNRTAHFAFEDKPKVLLWEDYQSRYLFVQNTASGSGKFYNLVVPYVVSAADKSLSGQNTPLRSRKSYYDTETIFQIELYLNGRLYNIRRITANDLEVVNSNDEVSQRTETALSLLLDSDDKIEVVIKAGKLYGNGGLEEGVQTVVSVYDWELVEISESDISSPPGSYYEAQPCPAGCAPCAGTSQTVTFGPVYLRDQKTSQKALLRVRGQGITVERDYEVVLQPNRPFTFDIKIDYRGRRGYIDVSLEAINPLGTFGGWIQGSVVKRFPVFCPNVGPDATKTCSQTHTIIGKDNDVPMIRKSKCVNWDAKGRCIGHADEYQTRERAYLKIHWGDGNITSRISNDGWAGTEHSHTYSEVNKSYRPKLEIAYKCGFWAESDLWYWNWANAECGKGGKCCTEKYLPQFTTCDPGNPSLSIVLYHEPSDPNDYGVIYKSIQDAIDNSTDGSLITLGDGLLEVSTESSPIVINSKQNITISGSGVERTVISSSESIAPLVITSSSAVLIKDIGFEISEPSSGISITDSYNSKLDNLRVLAKKGGSAINTVGGAGLYLTNSTIIGGLTTNGISAQSTKEISILSNVFSENLNGISLTNCNDSRISNNKFNNVVNNAIVITGNSCGNDVSEDNVFTEVGNEVSVEIPVCNTVPVNGSPHFAIAAKENIALSDRSCILAPSIGLNGSLLLGCDAEIKAGAIIAGEMHLSDRARIDGDIQLAGDVFKGNQNQIVGTIKEFYTIPEIVIPDELYIADSSTFSIANDQEYHFQPGIYGDVRIYSRAKVYFQPGDYFFRSLIFEPDVNISIDAASKSIYWKVVNEFSIGDRSRIINTNPELLQIHSLQSSSLKIGNDVEFVGSIKAPYALVEVCTKKKVDGSTRFRGPIQARAIRLEPDVIIDAR